MIESEKADIVLATETHLDDSFPSNSGLPPGYSAFRTDNYLGSGGTMLVYRNDLLVSPLDNGNSDVTWGKILVQGRKPIYIGSIYRNPASNVKMLECLEEDIAKLEPGNTLPLIILGGDINLPSIIWENSSVSPNPQYGSTINQKFIELIETFNLSQLVREPTRQNNILDVLLTTYPDYVGKISIIPGMSDHQAVVAEFTLGLKYNKKKPRRVFLFKKGNIQAIKDKLKELITSLDFNTRTVNENWEFLRDSIMEAIKTHIPSKKVQDGKHVPWLNVKIKRSIKKRKRLYNKAKKSGKDTDWSAFRKFRNTVRRNLDTAQDDYIKGILNAENLRTAPKKFWSFIAHKRKDQSGIPPLQTDGKTISNNREKADLLNTHYGSIFTKDDPTINPVLSNPLPDMPRFEIHSSGVLKLLKELEPHKACGPDKIPTYILRECAEEIAPLLTKIFTQSIEEGDLPEDWLSANVCPIFKKGNKSLPANYRPISLTSVSCKLLEHIIFRNIMAHVEKHHILKPYQHGFLKNHSCETQLINTVEEIMYYLDHETGAQIDMLVLDFSKAFDLVSHPKLVRKLEHYGVRGLTLRWINSWLTNRSQQVTIDGEMSHPIPVTSGVPQGTVLGPLMFLLYINDIGEMIDSNTRVKLFADDCLLFRPIREPKDQTQLQEDLNHLKSWADTWQMSFNPQKCEAMHITRSRKTKPHTYQIMGVNLKDVDQCRYLGVQLSSNMSWSNHISRTVNDANKILGVVRRNLSKCDPTVKQAAYLALVRPKLEYAASVWDPHQAYLINKLEMVQRRAARFVMNDYAATSSVTSMLNNLQWSSLQQRRRSSRLTLLYKALNQQSAIDIPPYVKPAIRSRGNDDSRFIPLHCRTHAYMHSYLPKTLINWNSLSIDTKNQSSAPKFQAALRTV